MTTYVYIDVLFLENFLLDFFLLYVTALINSRKCKLLRCAGGAAAGALYVCAAYFIRADLEKSFIMKFAALAVMLFIAFDIRKTSDFFKFLFTYIAANFILAGGIYFAQNLISSERMDGYAGIAGILLGVILIAVMGRGFFMLIKNAVMKKELTKDIILFYNNKTLKLKAFTDTGNSLIDPISRCSVVIVSKSKIKEAVDIKTVSKMKNFRLIPCRTVTGKYDLLYGFKPDKFIYENKEINAVAAISKEDFLSEGFDAIINPLTLV